jgi:hypothetical protein
MTAKGQGEYEAPRWPSGSKAGVFALGVLAGCTLMLVLFQMYFQPRFRYLDERLERVERGWAEVRSEAEELLGRGSSPGRDRAKATRVSAQ